MGDAAGIGPELCLAVLRNPRVRRVCVPVVFGDRSVLTRVARATHQPLPNQWLTLPEWLAGREPAQACGIDCGFLLGPVRPGRPQAACGRAAYRYVETAIRAATTGRVAGVVTAPLHKAALNRAGFAYAGHTEIFAALTRTRHYCMMLASDTITVALVTTHQALAQAVRHVSSARILKTIELTAHALRRFNGRPPRITVCALNPHAGESGLFGNEEKRLIIPALRAARRKGHRIIGPLPPDTAFLPSMRKRTDAYVVMYHDQGLIPFKMLAFDKGVNVTLGLPIIRTSPDHGTAYDLAWKAKASANSMLESVIMAAKLATQPH
jgi:4-hydroxythreonine-4-phosphate dehydrogenase